MTKHPYIAPKIKACYNIGTPTIMAGSGDEQVIAIPVDKDNEYNEPTFFRSRGNQASTWDEEDNL